MGESGLMYHTMSSILAVQQEALHGVPEAGVFTTDNLSCVHLGGVKGKQLRQVLMNIF